MPGGDVLLQYDERDGVAGIVLEDTYQVDDVDIVCALWRVAGREGAVPPTRRLLLATWIDGFVFRPSASMRRPGAPMALLTILGPRGGGRAGAGHASP